MAVAPKPPFGKDAAKVWFEPRVSDAVLYGKVRYSIAANIGGANG